MKQNDVANPSHKAVELLFFAFVDLLQLSDDKNVFEHITKEILDKFDPQVEDNIVFKDFLEVEDLAVILFQLPYSDETPRVIKSRIAKYLSTWGEKVGIPYIDKLTVTGMQVEQVEVPVDTSEIKKRKRSKKDVQESQALEDEWV